MPRAKRKEKRKTRKDRRKKDPFVVRMKRRGHELKCLGQTLTTEPGKFPSALLDFMRRSFRTVWDARGGGLYAVGYVLTFMWLEAAMLVDDVVSANSIAGFFGEQLFEMFFRYLGESFRNMILAFMWPVHVVTLVPPWGAIAFGLAYAGFDRFFRKPIEMWLFDDDVSQDDTASGSKEVQNDAG